MTTSASRPAGRVFSGRVPGVVVLGGLGVVLIVAAIMDLALGAVSVPPTAVLSILADAIGLGAPWPFEPRHQTIVLGIRLPRVVLGTLVGGTLAVAGATMQGLFRNPLADPALVGVSSGAAVAAGATIVIGDAMMAGFMKTFGPYALPIAAFGGGLATTALIYRVARFGGHTSVATMLLAGIALNAGAVGGVQALSYLSTDQQLRDLTFWLMGSIGGGTWRTIGPVVPLLLIAIVTLPSLSGALNALLLGEREAFHLGVDVERLKRIAVVAVALGVGAAVAVSGVIAFLGLMVPHLVRLVVGPDHRILLPASVLLGGALLLFADLMARTIVAPAELPIGIVTNLVGAPFFLWLLMRQRGRASF